MFYEIIRRDFVRAVCETAGDDVPKAQLELKEATESVILSLLAS